MFLRSTRYRIDSRLLNTAKRVKLANDLLIVPHYLERDDTLGFLLFYVLVALRSAESGLAFSLDRDHWGREAAILMGGLRVVVLDVGRGGGLNHF